MSATYRTSAAGGSSSGTSNRTAVITPVVGDLFVVFCNVDTNTNTTPTCTDNNGGDYDRIQVARRGTNAHTLSVFVRQTLLANTTSTTITVATGSNTSGSVVVVALSNMSKTGSAAVRQNARQENQAAAGTPAPAFASAALTDNPILGAVGNATNPATLTQPAGSSPTWSERQDVGQTSNAQGLHVISVNSGFTGTTVTWGSTSASAFSSIILELDGSFSPPTGALTLTGATPPIGRSVVPLVGSLSSPDGVPVLEDDFNRADTTDLGALYNPGPDQFTTGNQIVSNRVRAQVVNVSCWDFHDTAPSSAQWAEIDVPTYAMTSGQLVAVGLVLRETNASGFYLLTASYTTAVVLLIQRVQFNGAYGSYTTLTSVSLGTTPFAGTRLRFEARESDLRAYVNGTLTLSATDATYTSGRVGLHTYASDTAGLAAVELDNFAHGTLDIALTGYASTVFQDINLTPSRSVGLVGADDFNRANAGTLGASWTTDPDLSLGLQIVSNRARPQFAGGPAEDIHTAELSSSQWAEVDVPTFAAPGVGATNRIGLMLRQQTGDAGGAYVGYFNVNTVELSAQIYRLDYPGQSFVYLNNTTALPVTIAGSRLRFEAEGTALRLYHNNVLLLSATDATYTSGRAGLYLFAWTAVADIEVDNFASGNLDLALTGGVPTVSVDTRLMPDSGALTVAGDVPPLGYGLIPRSGGLCLQHPRITVATDDFNRTNATDLGAAWDPIVGSSTPIYIVSNVAQPGPGLDFGLELHTQTLAADQWAQIELRTLGTDEQSEHGVLLRGDLGTEDYYEFYAWNTDDGRGAFGIVREGGAIIAAEQFTDEPFQPGEIIRAEAIGSRLLLYRNEKLILETTHTLLTAGRAGIALARYALPLSDAELDNFSSGEFARTTLNLSLQPRAGGLCIQNPRTTVATDNFNRADSTDLGASWDVVGTSAAAQIVSNVCRAGPDSPAQAWGQELHTQTLSNDQWAQFTAVTHGTDGNSAFGVLLRGGLADGGTGYEFWVFGDVPATYGIWRDSVGGSGNVVTETDTDLVLPGEIFRAEIEGTRLRFYRNETLLAEATDTALTSGRAGISIVRYATPISLCELDNFASGEFDRMTVTTSGPLTPGAGALTTTGESVSYENSMATLLLVGRQGSIVIEGPVNTNRQPAAGSLTLAGAAPGLDRSDWPAFQWDGAFQLAEEYGFQTSLSHGLTPSTGALALTGAASSLLSETILTPSVGVLTLTEVPPTLLVAVSITPGGAGSPATIAMSELTGNKSDLDQTAYTTASISPAASTLILAAIVHGHGSAVPDQVELSGNGLTWTLVATQTFNTTTTARARVSLFSAIGASPTAGAVTISRAAGSSQTFDGCCWQILSGSGAESITQSAVNAADSSNSISVTLTTSTGTGNAALQIAGYNEEGPAGGYSYTPEAGYTAITHRFHPFPSRSLVGGYKLNALDQALTGTVSGSGSRHWGAIGAEVGAGTTAGLALTGAAPTVQTNSFLTPAVGSLTLTGAASSLVSPITLTPDVGSLTLTGYVPSSGAHTNLTPDTGTLTLTAQPCQPSGSLPTLILEGDAPTLQFATYLTPAAGALALTGAAPVVRLSLSATPATGGLTLTGQTSSLSGSLVPAAGTLTLSGLAPVLSFSTSIQPLSSGLTLTGTQPGIGLTLTPNTPSDRIAARHLTTSADTTDLSVFTTASITPTANALVLAWIGSSVLTAPAATVTLSGCGLTWVEVATVTYAGSLLRLTLFRAMGTAPTAGTVTITNSKTTRGCLWSFVEISGTATTGTAGADAIVQSVTNSDEGLTTALTVTLAAYANAENLGVAGFHSGSVGDHTAGTGWTDLGKATHAGPSRAISTQWNGTGDTTADVTAATGTSLGGIAVEVAASTTRALLLTGYAPTLSVSTVLQPPAGALALTGVAPTRIVSTSLTPLVGALTLTGLAPTRSSETRLTPNTGQITVTGQQPARAISSVLTPAAGALVLTGETPTRITGTIPTPTAGALTFTGGAPSLLRGTGFIPATGELQLTGAAPGIGTSIIPGTGELLLTGTGVNMPGSGRPEAAVLQLEGYAPTIVLPVSITPAAGTLTLTGQQPRLDLAIRPSAGALTFTSAASQVRVNGDRQTSTGALTLTGQLSSVVTGITPRPAAGALNFTGYAPTVLAAGALTPVAGTLTLTGYAPRREAGTGGPVGAGSLTLTGYAPAVSVGTRLTPPAGALTLTGQAPAVQMASRVTPAAGALTLTGAAPTILTPTRLVPGTGALTLTGQLPTLSFLTGIRPATGALTITGGASVVIGDTSLAPATGVLVLAGAAGSIEIGPTDVVATPGAGALVLEGSQPMGASVLLTPDTGTLVLQGAAPAISRFVYQIIQIANGALRSSTLLNGALTQATIIHSTLTVTDLGPETLTSATGEDP